MLIYFLKTILIQAIGLGIYYAFLRNEKLFKYSRSYLWIIVALSFLIPFISFPIFETSSFFQEVNNASDEVVITLPMFIVSASGSSTISWFMILTVAIVLVSLVQVLRLFLSFKKIISIKRGAQNQGKNIYLSEDIELPFSFLGSVYIPKRFENSESLPIIIAHEDAHIKKKHSLDKIVISFLCRICWFNPIFVLFHKELEQIHEYQVDESVSQEYSLDNYLESFLQSAMLIQSNPICLTHSFFSSPIKNRIIMLYKKSKNKLIKKSVSALILTLFLSGMVFIQCQGQTMKTNNNIEVINFGEKDTVYVEDPVTGNLEMRIIEKKPMNIYKKVDKEPEYPGGNVRLVEYLQRNLNYPKEAKKNKTEGTVYIEFIVDEHGQIVNPQIKKGVPNGGDLDREALSILTRMERNHILWVPARHQNKDVGARMVLPIQFKL